MKIPPMRANFLLLCFLLSTVMLFAQRPDSIQVNGEWYFIYPLQEEVLPAYTMLRRADLSEKQFSVLLEWKMKGDPRATYKHRQLEDSLNAELLRTNRILSEEQDRNNWEEGTEPPYYWGGNKVRKSLMRKFPALNVDENNPATYDLVPSVNSLPDGKYIQFFAPFLTYTKCRKMQVISGKTAAVFSLKDNLLHGKYLRLNYNGDTVKIGTFEDGLKEGSWFIRLASDYETKFKKGTSKNTLETIGTKIYIDLTDGVPNGNFRSVKGKYSETRGQFENGFATGFWEVNNGGYAQRYSNIISGEKWVTEDKPLNIVIADENAKRAEGFDFAERKGRYFRPDTYEEFVKANSRIVNPGVVLDFKALESDPLKNNLHYYYSYDWGNYINEDVFARFSGSRETYIEGWLEERISVDPVTQTLSYSQYYENGHLFDTMAFNAVDSTFHYRMYDINGKLYLENTYDLNGTILSRVCYASFKEKQPKQEKQPKMITIEGFPVLVDRNFYETYGGIGYVWENFADSIIDGKIYRFIAWDYDTKKRKLEEYYLSDTLHQLHYNKWGEPAFEKQTVWISARDTTVKLPYEQEVKFISYWDQFSWIAARDTSGFFQVKLYKNDQPYSGHLKIRFSRKKVGKQYSGGGNELVLTIPRYYYSRKMSDRFLNWELYTLEEDLYHTKERWGYKSSSNVYNSQFKKRSLILRE